MPFTFSDPLSPRDGQITRANRYWRNAFYGLPASYRTSLHYLEPDRYIRPTRVDAAAFYRALDRARKAAAHA